MQVEIHHKIIQASRPASWQITQSISACSDGFPDPTVSALLIFLMNISFDHILPFNFMVSDPQSGVRTLSSAWCMPGFTSTDLFIALVI